MSIDATPPDELVPGWLIVLAALALAGHRDPCPRARRGLAGDLSLDRDGGDPGRGDDRGDRGAGGPEPPQPGLVAGEGGRGGKPPRARGAARAAGPGRGRIRAIRRRAAASGEGRRRGDPCIAVGHRRPGLPGRCRHWGGAGDSRRSRCRDGAAHRQHHRCRHGAASRRVRDVLHARGRRSGMGDGDR